MAYKDPQRKRENERRRIAKKRATLDQYKLQTGCADCGYKENAVVLEFDHREPLQKRYSVANMGLSRKVFEKELAKCDVVCANCHKIRTASRPKRKRDRAAIVPVC